MVHHLANPSRLEAFSDGVIAVIITIMVLELKIPTQNGLAGLMALMPTLAIYALSFAFTGIYWINHHHLVHRIEETDSLILYANLVFLFCLSLLPFFTGYLLEKKMDSFSVAFYGLCMTVCGFSFLLLRLAVTRRLKASQRLEEEDTAQQVKHWLSLVTYGTAIPLAFRYPHVSLGLIALVTLLWITPTAGTKPHLHHHPGELQ